MKNQIRTPTGWQWSKVKHTASFYTGWTPPTGTADYFVGDNLWANISDLGPRELTSTTKCISDEAVKISAIKLSPAGSLLFSFKLSIGQVSFAGQDMYTNEAIATFPNQVNYNSRWAFWALPIFVPMNANENIYGAKLLNQELIRSADLLVPPLGEQEKIADFLDEKTGRIDALIAEKVRLKDSLEEWQSAELTRHCYGTDLPCVITGNEWIPSLPEGWTVVRLKHLVQGIEQGWSPECDARQAEPDEWGVLKAGAANGGQYRDFEHKTLPSHLEPVTTLEVKPGDVLITRASGTAEYVGSFAYVYKTRPKLMLSDKNFRLKFATSPRLLPELLAWVANTDTVRQQVAQFVSGAEGLAKNIGSGNLREVWFPVPPFDTQHEILARIRESHERVENLSVHLDEHLSRLQEYRASLISSAVTGQLDVSQFKVAA